MTRFIKVHDFLLHSRTLLIQVDFMSNWTGFSSMGKNKNKKYMVENYSYKLQQVNQKAGEDTNL